MTPIQASEYQIFFNIEGYNHLNQLINEENYSGIYIIVDENSNEHCLPIFIKEIATEIAIEIIEIEQGEDSKNILNCIEIWNILSDYGADRKSLIINLGGGVISDLGGFIASTFKRGIDFINIPTTLLAMVDASIGGKNGIDFNHVKNQIGTIVNPKMILIDTQFLETLPQNQLLSGVAEMIKHGLIADADYWEKFLDIKNINFEQLEILIYKSIVIKNQIVMSDPKEKSIRKSLNFGHTIGHAIESYFNINSTKKTLLHGECVAIGMVLEAYISFELELITCKEFELIQNTIFNLYEKIKLEDSDIDKIMDLMKFDKKNEHGNILFSLLNGIGHHIINQNIDNNLIYKSLSILKS